MLYVCFHVFHGCTDDLRCAAWASIDEVLPVSAASISWAKGELQADSRWSPNEFDASLRILLATLSDCAPDSVPAAWLLEPPVGLCSASREAFSGMLRVSIMYIFACCHLCRHAWYANDMGCVFFGVFKWATSHSRHMVATS